MKIRVKDSEFEDKIYAFGYKLSEHESAEIIEEIIEHIKVENVEKENLKKYALLNQEVMWLVVASNVGNLETFEKAKEKINKLEALEIYRKIKY